MSKVKIAMIYCYPLTLIGLGIVGLRLFGDNTVMYINRFLELYPLSRLLCDLAKTNQYALRLLLIAIIILIFVIVVTLKSKFNSINCNRILWLYLVLTLLLMPLIIKVIQVVIFKFNLTSIYHYLVLMRIPYYLRVFSKWMLILIIIYLVIIYIVPQLRVIPESFQGIKQALKRWQGTEKRIKAPHRTKHKRLGFKRYSFERRKILPTIKIDSSGMVPALVLVVTIFAIIGGLIYRLIQILNSNI